MKELIDKINERDNWNTDYLSLLITNASYHSSATFLQKVSASEDTTLDNIVCVTLEHILIKIKVKNTWSKEEIQDIIFKKLVDEISG